LLVFGPGVSQEMPIPFFIVDLSTTYLLYKLFLFIFFPVYRGHEALYQ